jgi:hypothetical protein
MNRVSILCVMIILHLVSTITPSAPPAQSKTLRSYSKPPKFYIDKEACPFECCTYRTWKTQKTTIAYARPDTRAPQIGRFRAGSTVVALTGEVHTSPGRFIVKKAYQGNENYRPGDVLWVYTYSGEGYFKVWFRGKMYQESLVCLAKTPSGLYFQ